MAITIKAHCSLRVHFFSPLLTGISRLKGYRSCNATRFKIAGIIRKKICTRYISSRRRRFRSHSALLSLEVWQSRKT